MLSFGSVVIIECIQKFCLVEMIGTNFCFFVIILYAFKSTGCEFCALAFMGTTQLERTGGIFHFIYST